MKVFIILCLTLNLLVAASASLEAMIAQMIVVGFDGSKKGDKWVEQVVKDLEREKIGGVWLQPKNIHSPTQLKALSAHLHAAAPKTVPAMIVVDVSQEEALSTPKGFASFPSPLALAKGYDIEQAIALYQKHSNEIAHSGINVVLGPFLDLQPHTHSHPYSFSAYEEIVTTYAQLYLEALRQRGVYGVVKYFPSAGVHAWEGFKHRAELGMAWNLKQLKPYYDLIAMGMVEGVLISHAVVTPLDPKVPALFSYPLIEGVLREKIHFDGLVWVNNLGEASLPSQMDLKERIIQAIKAGADVFVFGSYFANQASTPFRVAQIIQEAIASKEISKERIERSYKRIITFKQHHLHVKDAP